MIEEARSGIRAKLLLAGVTLYEVGVTNIFALSQTCNSKILFAISASASPLTSPTCPLVFNVRGQLSGFVQSRTQLMGGPSNLSVVLGGSGRGRRQLYGEQNQI